MSWNSLSGMLHKHCLNMQIAGAHLLVSKMTLSFALKVEASVFQNSLKSSGESMISPLLIGKRVR